jgi:hypothetical protein
VCHAHPRRYVCGQLGAGSLLLLHQLRIPGPAHASASAHSRHTVYPGTTGTAHHHRRHKAEEEDGQVCLDVDSQVLQAGEVVHQCCQEPSGVHCVPIEAASACAVHVSRQAERSVCQIYTSTVPSYRLMKLPCTSRNTLTAVQNEQQPTGRIQTGVQWTMHQEFSYAEVWLQLSAGRRPAQEIGGV